MLDKKIDFEILIVGKDKQISKYLKEIDQNIRERTRIEPLTPNIEEYLQNIDILFYPAYFEEFGMVVQEAMACGVAILTSNNVGVSEIFHNKNFIVKNPTPKEFAQELERLLVNSDYLEVSKQNSIQSIQNSSWNNYFHFVLQ